MEKILFVITEPHEYDDHLNRYTDSTTVLFKSDFGILY